MKKIFRTFVSLTMVSCLALSGCGSNSGSKESQPADAPASSEASGSTENTAAPDTPAPDTAYNIVVMPKLVGIPYFTATGEGALKAGEDLGVNVIYNGPTVADAAEQVKMIEDYITQGVDAICVAPNDAAALDPVLKKARAAGILVLDWDTEATKDLVDASIHQISDKEFGEHMLEMMVEHMGTEEGEWAIVTGGLSASNLNAWIKYAREYAEANYPGLALVADPFPTDEKQDVAISTTKDIMKAYPDVKGILCVSTPAPIGAAIAIRELGLQEQVTVVGSAVEADCQDVLSDGSLDLGCLWSCEDLGYLTVGVAKALLDGETLSDGMEIEGFGKVELSGEKDIILGPPQDYTK